MKHRKQRTKTVSSLLLLGCLSFVDAVAADTKSNSIKLGIMQVTTAGSDRGITPSGRAMLLTNNDGSSSAYTQVIGLEPFTSYGSHVHNLPCSLGGGGHYKNDPDVPGAVESNELWVNFTTNDAGIGLGQASQNFSVRPDAQSVVVHDVDGVRIACADLSDGSASATVNSGSMINFTDQASFGSAQIARSNGSTLSILRVEDLEPNTTYQSHVHNLTCDVNSGGSHYKIDPSVATREVDNEIWLPITTDANGNGSNTVRNEGHIARPEAQSIVVHAPDGSRVGCADLLNEGSRRITTSGAVLTTEAGLQKGYRLEGWARMERKRKGVTRVKMKVKGLARHVKYPTNVHDLPCKLGGGGHYKVDPSVLDTEQSNEIWTPLVYGWGFAKVMHVARPEAQSIVIHDPVDNVRIGCIDLD